MGRKADINLATRKKHTPEQVVRKLAAVHHLMRTMKVSERFTFHAAARTHP